MTTAITPESVCARIVERIVNAVGTRRYEIWFQRSARLDFHDAPPRLEIKVRNQFIADWIGRHFLQIVRDATSHEVDGPVDLSIAVAPNSFDVTPPEAPIPTAPVATRVRATEGERGGPPALRYRLESFVVGTSNELAYSSAMRLVDGGEEHLPGPLFLHGGCGLGKTHLLQGICQRMLSRVSRANVLYTTAEQFTNEFLAAVRLNRMESFRQRVRKLDLLAVDDVHFLANKQATQQEFIHSFDAIQLGGARVALASDNHPKLIQQFSERLISRCMNGMVVEVHDPDTETRVRIIRSLAVDRGISLVDGVIATLAQHCSGSVREIEGTLTRLHALATLVQQRRGSSDDDLKIGHAMLHRLLQSEGESPSDRPVRFADIQEVISRRFGVSSAEIQGRSRHKHVVLARALVIYLARQRTTMSFPEIAAQMNRSSHSTVVSASRRTAEQLAAEVSVVVPGDVGTMPLRSLVDELDQTLRRR